MKEQPFLSKKKKKNGQSFDLSAESPCIKLCYSLPPPHGHKNIPFTSGSRLKQNCLRLKQMLSFLYRFPIYQQPEIKLFMFNLT